MRSINDAYSEILSTDPKTAITKSGLRRLVNTGEIPSVEVGRKRLINMDVLREYFIQGSPNNQESSKVNYGEIRKIG